MMNPGMQNSWGHYAPPHTINPYQLPPRSYDVFAGKIILQILIAKLFFETLQ